MSSFLWRLLLILARSALPRLSKRLGEQSEQQRIGAAL